MREAVSATLALDWSLADRHLASSCRGAGIHTPEAIRLVWSCHREVIHDFGPVTAEASSLKTT